MNVHQKNCSDPSDQDIANLVQGLDNLQWNLQVQADIFTLGERAVPALVAFLHGPASQFAEGRVLAAEALGRIGGEAAFQGLMKALDPHRLEHLTPVLRFSEETVQDAVARQLARIGDGRAVPILLEVLRTTRSVGAAEALKKFEELEALPWMVDALEDAFKRVRFAQLILEWGPAAIRYLVQTLDVRRMRDDEELLPSLERRAEALKLLGLLDAKPATAMIRSALTDASDRVRMEAALARAALETDADVLDAVPALLAGLNHPDFIQRDRCADALIRIGQRCSPLVEHAVAVAGIMVGPDAVPLTANARHEALAVLERLKEQRHAE